MPRITSKIYSLIFLPHSFKLGLLQILAEANDLILSFFFLSQVNVQKNPSQWIYRLTYFISPHKLWIYWFKKNQPKMYPFLDKFQAYKVKFSCKTSE
jgi:hypothetical protein